MRVEVGGWLRESGFEVYLEDQTTMRAHGQCRLKCKPDIVAVKPGTVLVVGCKTGNPGASGTLQIRLYMHLLVSGARIKTSTPRAS